MDLTATYCQIRRDLEERSWVMVSRHAALTSRLLRLTGRGHQAFLDAKEDCRISSEEVNESQNNLRIHRREHGC